MPTAVIVAVVATLSAVIILGLLVGALILCCYIHRRFAKLTPSLTSTNQSRQPSEYYVGMSLSSAGGIPLTQNTTYGEHPSTCNRELQENVPYNYGSRLKYYGYDYPDVNTAREVPLTQNRVCGNREVDELRENIAYNRVPNLQYQEYVDVVGKSAGDVLLTQNRAYGEHPSNKEVELHDNIAYN